VSQTSGATRRLWVTKAPPTSALRDYGLASQARETDGDGAPIFTPEFPKADPYQFLELVCIEVIVSLNLDFAAQKEGGMAVSAVWTLVAFSNSLPIGIKEQNRSTQARRAVPLRLKSKNSKQLV
jgi:hypothetical protein